MEKIKAHLTGQIITSVDEPAFSLHAKSYFGELKEDKIQYSIAEAIFLVDEDKMEIYSNNKKITKKDFIEKCRKIDRKIQIKYPVFQDLREKGYVVKTALKYGADFRVYEKGIKPGDKHAKWIVFAEHESNRLAWHEFSAKNRVAHSVKKNLLLAIVDEEGDISYYEVQWIKP